MSEVKSEISNDPKLGQSEAASGSFFIALSLTAALLLFYETVAFQLLVFISDYMNAMLILAIALCGISLGSLSAWVLRQRNTGSLYIYAAALLPISIILAFACFCIFPDNKYIYSILAAPPFIIAGFIISKAFSLAAPHKVYFYDLGGAALGAILAAFSVPVFREEGSFIIITVIGFSVCLVFCFSFKSRKTKVLKILSAAGIIIALTVLVTNQIYDYLNLATLVSRTDDSSKIFSRHHRYEAKPEKKKKKRYHKLLYSEGSLVERIDMVSTSKKRIKTYYNGYCNDHIETRHEKKYPNDVRLMKGLVENPDTLVIGAAAEGVVKTAKGLGFGDVVGLEINPAIVKLMRDNKYIYDFSRKAYKDIELHVIDARSYLKRTDRKFDIITLMNTHRMRNIGYTGIPEYLHTVEALSDIFEHLKDDGWLILEERDVNDRARVGIQRFILNVKYVLKNHLKADDVSKHFWVYNWYGIVMKRHELYTQIYIKKDPINDNDLKNIGAWERKQSDRFYKKHKGNKIILTYKPGVSSGSATEKIILADDPYEIYDKQIYNLATITDDRPFPFDVTHSRPHFFNILLPVVLLTLLLGFLPVLLVLIFGRERESAGAASIFRTNPVWSISSLFYFALLGLGYLIVEVVLIQSLQIFLGMPVLTLAVVLAAMLLFSGLGSLLTVKLGHKKTLAGIALVAVIAVLTISLSNLFVDTLIFLPISVRIILTALFVAPLSLLMGMPFPYGMEKIKNRAGGHFATVMFGLNGAFSALATPLALYLATVSGYTATFYIGAAFYALCFLIAILVFNTNPQEKHETLSQTT